jgi:hypothetical protein
MKMSPEHFATLCKSIEVNKDRFKGLRGGSMTADARDLFRTILCLVCMMTVAGCLLFNVGYYQTGLANLACLLSLLNAIFHWEDSYNV